MDRTKLNHYLSLEQPEDMTQITYVWIGGYGDDLRNKTKTLNKVPKTVDEVPDWSVGDFCMGMKLHRIDEYILKPVRMYRDPFRLGNNKIVLCELYETNGTPFVKNYRKACADALAQVETEHEPWFGFEQEYYILDKLTKRPYQWPSFGFPPPQGPHLYGVGDTHGREIPEAHYRACIYAGIQFYGDNAEVVPAQWEYQLGPSPGLKLADDLWMSRYLLHRIAEDFNVVISLDPKPIPGADWNGSGGHFSISTKETRQPEVGLDNILGLIKNLEKTHLDDIKEYDPHGGADNRRRLDGSNPTLSNLDTFTSGIANRGASVRVPQPTADAKCGYFEDRRPASNCDPYCIINRLIRSMYKIGH